MKYRLPLVLLVFVVCMPAFGQIEPEHAQTSEPCFWNDGGTCFSYQEEADMSGGGSSAPGMISCSSTKGCLDCVVPVKSTTGKEECATLLYQNGYCKCGITSDGRCGASGACTYVR